MANIQNNDYTDDNIRTLEGVEHIRRRPGMYIGRLGNGSNPGDGIYVLLKEIVDNCIDEFSAGFGRQVIIDIDGRQVSIRDFGRGIPLNSVVKATSQLNTGGKFDDKAFKKSVGLNGVGTKAVNALSEKFYVEIPSGTAKAPGRGTSAESWWAATGKRKSARRTEPSWSSHRTARCSGTSSSTWTTWRPWSRITPTLRKG